MSQIPKGTRQRPEDVNCSKNPTHTNTWLTRTLQYVEAYKHFKGSIATKKKKKTNKLEVNNFIILNPIFLLLHKVLLPMTN